MPKYYSKIKVAKSWERCSRFTKSIRNESSAKKALRIKLRVYQTIREEQNQLFVFFVFSVVNRTN